MRFGLVNASFTFSRYIAEIFRDIPFILVYLDEILVISTSKEEHKHLDPVLQRLRDHQLIAKDKKCKFLQPEIEFVGYHISERCIRPLKDSIGYNKP